MSRNSVDQIAALVSRCGQLGLYLPFLLALFLIIGCASNGGMAPVSDRTSPSPAQKPSYHLVQKGDTLYSISWRYGVDYKELSVRNGIKKGYTIYPGQKIYLDTSKPSVTNKSSTVKKPSQTTSRTSVAKKPVSTRSTSSTPQATYNHFAWQWAARGRIIRNYSPKSGLNKGIDIEGRLGEPVLSAAPGTVVYSGDGLRGYGKLLIIKHNETFLSAYAHNHKLLVKEGEIVKGNQKIAEIGSSGTDTTKLHFEIRREGKPVDPLQYLPKR